jgi:hypothetical protein
MPKDINSYIKEKKNNLMLDTANEVIAKMYFSECS